MVSGVQRTIKTGEKDNIIYYGNRYCSPRGGEPKNPQCGVGSDMGIGSAEIYSALR